jgi:hypothetical protein
MLYSNYFYDLFFKSSLSLVSDPQFKVDVVKELKDYTHAYQDKNPAPVIFYPEKLKQWYETEGQNILINVFANLWQILSDLSQNAMPSHDARHAIFKVPASALELINAEGVTSWERVGVIGALIHDWGRWGEERIYNAPQGGSIHSRMSFVLAQEYLEGFNIPSEIKWHILNAAMVHTKGADESDPLVTQITVTADREQLWGPEFILRILHHVKTPGSCEVFYKEEGKDDLFSKFEKIFRNRLLGPLHSRNEHLKVLKGSLAQFLYLSGTDEFKANINEFMENSQSWLFIDYKYLLQQADSFHTPVKSAGEALKILLNTNNIAPNQHYIDSAVERVMNVPGHLNQRLAKAIMFAHEAKLIEEKRIKNSLSSLMKGFKNDKFLYYVTLTIHDKI